MILRRRSILAALAAATLVAGFVTAPHADAVTASFTVEQVSLSPTVIQAGLPYQATLVVDAGTDIQTVQDITVAVRDASGDNLDFPGSHSATLGGGSSSLAPYVYTSGPMTFAAGTYTEFGSYEIGGTWHPLTSQTLTVTPAPSSTDPNPGPVGIPGVWTSSLNDGPGFNNGAATDNVGALLDWRGGPDNGPQPQLTTPHNTSGSAQEDDCYNSANVSQSGSFVDLKLTDPGTTTPCLAYSAGNYYGAQVVSDSIIDPATGTSTSFEPQFGAFEAEVYLPPAPDGTIADWPAFWLTGIPPTPWPENGEIDAIEGLNGTGCYTFHYGTPTDRKADGSFCTSIGPGWHTIGVDWQHEPSAASAYVTTYYYDGKSVGTIAQSGIVETPMELVLDITATIANANGNERVFNSPVQVAWIRAWTGSNGPIPITVGGDQFCLDDWHSGTANFNKVDIYGCNGGVAQSWDLESNGTVVSDLGGCLDVYFSGTTSGTHVDYHQCNGTGAQQWQAKSDGELVNPESGLCLTDTGASKTAGTQLTIATCTGAADQIWQ
jgi:hypothetical protein